MIEMTVKMEGLDKVMRSADPRRVRQAARLTLNDTAKAARTEGSKAVREEFNLKARDINQKLKFRKAMNSNLEAVLAMRLDKRGIGLMRFGATARRGRAVTRKVKGEVTTTQLKRASRSQGVTVKIRAGKKPTRLRNAFIARGAVGRGGALSSQTAQVWVRNSKGQLIPKRIPRHATLFFSNENQRRMLVVATRTMAKQFDYHFARLTKK